MSYAKHSVLIAFTSAALLGCAAASGPKLNWQDQLARQGYRVVPGEREVPDYRVDGFNALDATHVVIHDSPGRAYLVSLAYYCRPLPYAQNIGFSTTGERLTKFDKLLVFETRAPAEQCPIAAINTLEKAAPAGSPPAG